MAKLDYVIMDLLESTARNIKAHPLNLGGIAGGGGGVGGPPGGFIGWLPQTRVAYDEDEFATPFNVGSGSLLDNLNHIRYRLNILESGGSIIVVDDDIPDTFYDVTTVHFSGAGVVVTDLGDGEVLVAITAAGSGGGMTTEEVQDIVGNMVTGNTETGITVTYEDSDGTLDFVLSDEYIQDVVGAMLAGNTETGISVTYDDSDGTIDFDAQTAGDARYAPIAKGVTNGDTHDHSGGDGATLSFNFPFATYIDGNPITATGKFPYGGTIENSMAFVRFTISVYTAVSHSGSAYYTLTLKARQSTPGADVTVLTVDTKTIVGGQQNIITTTTFTTGSLTGQGYLYLEVTKTSTPADIYILCPSLRCTLS